MFLDFIVQEFDQQTAWKWICIEDTNEKSALDLASKKLAKILNQYDPMNNNDAKKSNCTVQ